MQMAKKEARRRVIVLEKPTIAQRLAGIGSLAGSIFKILLYVVLAVWILSIFLPGVEIINGNVAVIPIKGIITTGSSPSMFSEFTSSSKIVKWIEKADKSEKVSAILFEINSPGGSPVATNEIVQAVKATTKPTYAVIKDVGASGAYWVASATDVIIADSMSMTGSIGVIASYLEFSGMLDDYNITYQRLVSGKYKDMGSKYRQLTQDETVIMQKKIDLIYEIFVADVAENRNIPLAKMRKIASGTIYIGTEAKELGLVDVLGTKKDAVKLIEEQLGIKANLYEFKTNAGLFGGFSDTIYEGFYSIGQGIGSAFTSKAESREVSVWT